ncbi:molybdate transport system permease protein [Paraburkholderia sp. UCT70]
MQQAWVPLLLSLKVAGWATALTLVLGVAAALGLSRWRSGARDVIDSLLMLPLVLPPTVLGYYLLVLLGRRGVIGAWLDRFDIQLVFTWQGAVIASTVVAFPLVLKSSRAAFEGVDPQLERAARTLGVSETAVFFRVTLPLAARGILAGGLLAFARALGEFGATLMIAGNLPGRTQTLSVAVYSAVQAGDDSTANFLVLVTSVACVTILLLAGRSRAAAHASESPLTCRSTSPSARPSRPPSGALRSTSRSARARSGSCCSGRRARARA